MFPKIDMTICTVNLLFIYINKIMSHIIDLF